MPRNNLPFWIRCMEGPGAGGSGGSGGQETPPGAPAAGATPPPPETPPAGETPKETGTGGQDEQVDDKSKTAPAAPTAAELAAEREKTSALEAELATLRAAEEARTREQMTELEKAQADLKKAAEEKAQLAEELSKRDRENALADLAAEFKIPPAMIGRIQGTTPEEMRTDAEALSQAIGPYNGPSDPSAGRGGGRGPAQHTTLGAALAAHYGQ